MKGIQENFKDSSEHQIAQLVYKLYNLTDEGIKIVEGEWITENS